MVFSRISVVRTSFDDASSNRMLIAVCVPAISVEWIDDATITTVLARDFNSSSSSADRPRGSASFLWISIASLRSAMVSSELTMAIIMRSPSSVGPMSVTTTLSDASSTIEKYVLI